MNEPIAQQIDHRALALSKLAELALKRAALKEALSPFETQIAAIQRACTEATAEEATGIEQLEDELKQMALNHGEEIFGADKSSLMLGLLLLSTRPTEKVELTQDEQAVIDGLLKAAKSHPEKATRLAAHACVRTKHEINKTFVRENWDAFSEWFSAFGLTLVEGISASITEKKPARPKPSKPTRKPKGEQPEAPQELEAVEEAAC